jgi:hypothetical protein
LDEHVIERWENILGYDGYYQVSNCGRVRSTGSKARVLKQVIDKRWNYSYVTIGLLRQGKKTYKVARLVAKAFIPNPMNLPEVNHKDLNKQNNSVENLEWCTSSENVQHSWDSGKRKITYHLSKLTVDDVFEIRCLKYYGATSKAVAEAYSIHRDSVTNIWSGRSWSRV